MWVVNSTLRPFYPPRKIRYPLYRRLGGPHSRSGLLRKISPPPGFDPRTVQPVASRHTDCAIPTHRYAIAEITFIGWKGPLKFSKVSFRIFIHYICVPFLCPFHVSVFIFRLKQMNWRRYIVALQYGMVWNTAAICVNSLLENCVTYFHVNCVTAKWHTYIVYYIVRCRTSAGLGSISNFVLMLRHTEIFDWTAQDLVVFGCC